MCTYAITGTNGKTSSTYLLRSIIAAANMPVLQICTTGIAFAPDPDSVETWDRGTGDFSAFIGLFEQAVRRGARHAVTEATSQGLAQGYAKHWRFDVGVFTNLSPDHLKTHGTYEAYLAAKAQLFAHLGPGAHAIFNAADPHVLMVEHVTPPDVHRHHFHAPHRGPALVEPDLAAREVSVTASGTHVVLAPSPFAEALGGAIDIRLVGAVFAENALAVATAALATGIDPAHVRRGLGRCEPVPGRFEVVARDPLVVVDYAHTEDALRRTLEAARALVPGRVAVVFGAGGGSTPQKRGPLGAVAGELADFAIVTNDNPRREDPALIAQAVSRGVERAGRAELRVQLDRRKAITEGLAWAGRDDIVVIAGKGHETGQKIGSEVLPFCDAQTVRELVGAPD